ncbi:MAG: helix-hairpin-helix domain-containing protein [Candidatus Sulfotelmatobacter sp.]
MTCEKFRVIFLRAGGALFASVMVCTTIACTAKDNPDQIRERTAEATQTMRRDAKAVAEGVKEGMSSDKVLNVNEASRSDLLTLPGLTERDADRIIAERPFHTAQEMVSRNVISEAEYDRIHDRVMAGH